MSKWVYSKRLEEQYCRGHEEKWESIMSENNREIDWNKIYTNNFICNVESSLRAFQYQVILRTLPTNKFLLKCNLKNTDSCSFCELHEETIEHLFWFCPLIKNFWYWLLDEVIRSRRNKNGA